ncbi:MAG: hypothetical protein IPQ26_07415 [Elusimicrobia bacterium]|nr:hypothetical protein [Elusimicrobiota bacterium]
MPAGRPRRVSFTGNLRIDSVVAQGCRPIGRPLRVTGCKENALLAVDGKPRWKSSKRFLRNCRTATANCCARPSSSASR